MGYSITSESQFIDVQTIESGCNEIRNAGECYKNCAKKLEDAADICNINALSVDKKTMQPTMYEMATEIKKIRENVNSFSENIQELANDILTSQKKELEAYRAYQRELKAKESIKENNDAQVKNG